MTTMQTEYGELTITRDAVMDNCAAAPDGVAYYGKAEDKQGNAYSIVWYLSQAYRDAQAENPDCGYCEDESNACDWDNPDIVTPE